MLLRPIFAILFSVGFLTLALSQNQPEEVIDQIVIQENRLALPFSDNSRSISIISREQIEATPAKDIAELLLTVAGIDVRQRGIHGVQADIGIRGGTFDQTLVLINGIKMIDPQTGHHTMNIPINIHAIERIEILKGPASRIYGQNAFSGAINIITRKPDSNRISFGVDYGTFGSDTLVDNTLGLSFVNNIVTEKSSHLFILNRNTSDGYKYNTDYKVENIFGQSQIEVAGQTLSLTLGHSWREFGANGFYASPDFMDQYEEITTTFASASYKMLIDDWVIVPRFTYRKNQDDYVFLRDDPSFFQNMHISHNALGEINAHKQNKFGVLGLGVEYNRMELESNNLGERERNLFSGIIEQRFQTLDGKLDVTPGLSYTAYSDFDNKLFPGLDIGYRFSDRLKGYINYGFTYRVPTYTDRFYADSANLGNPDLQPEQAVTYEAGVKYKADGLRAAASFFRREGTDLIDWVKEAASSQWTPINIGEITTQGAELELSYDFGNSQLMDQVSLGYTFINADQSDVDVAFSRYALEHLNHQLVAGLQYGYENFYHSAQFRYLDRENLDDYSIVDTKLGWKSSNIDINLSVTNLLNTDYKETNLVQMPGRWLMGGVRYTLDY